MDYIKPLTVYTSATFALLTNFIANVHQVMSLLVVSATLVYIVYQIIEKHRALTKKDSK
jgi:hypothetical protein